MREWCSCGASIRARRRDVIRWRGAHRHDQQEQQQEPDRQGAQSQVEHAGPRYYEHEANYPGVDHPIVQALGFQPNPRRR